MAARLPLGEQRGRLAWLLVFRAAVATLLLGVTLAADVSDSPLRLISPLMYGVVIGTYLVVFVLGLLLRADVSPPVVAAVHLATAVMAAMIVVSGTGGVDSMMSFLYLLVILDGAIVGGRKVAMAVASASSLAYGVQLLAQMYGVWYMGTDVPPAPMAYVVDAVAHLTAFLLVGFLAGYLADLLRAAREVAVSAQSDLRRAELAWQSVVEVLPVGLVTYGAEGEVLTANPAAVRLLAASGVELVMGKSLPDPLHPDSLPAQGQDVSLESGGAVRQVAVYRSDADLGVDARGGGVLVLSDRTELEILRRDLLAKERLASLGELAAAIAHEIRNPLAAISGSVELLITQPGPGDTTRRLQDIVVREIDRLNQMVGDFLSYARPTRPRTVPVAIGSLVEEVRDVLTRDAAFAGNTVEVVSTRPMRAAVDPRQLRQVLWNLLRNALQASRPDGTVTVVVGARDDDLVLEVRDHGSGIPDDILPSIFEPFRTSKPTGTGLGLAVVHRIVDSHGGTISVESAVNEGTTFRLEFPSALRVGPRALASGASG